MRERESEKEKKEKEKGERENLRLLLHISVITISIYLLLVLFTCQFAQEVCIVTTQTAAVFVLRCTQFVMITQEILAQDFRSQKHFFLISFFFSHSTKLGGVCYSQHS